MLLHSVAKGTLRLKGKASGTIIHFNFSSAKGILHLNGRTTPRIPGKVTTEAHGYLLLNGAAGGYVNAPYGSFSDFSHYGIGAVDPAMALVGSQNGGLTSLDPAQTSGYRRYYVVLSAPNDYGVSNETKAWSKAVYAGVGLKFKGLVSTGTQIIDGIQFGLTRNGSGGPAPFQRARSLNSTLAATRSNLAFNPAAMTANGTVATKIGDMPGVSGYSAGSDGAAWQSTERVFIGTNSVAIDWYSPEYPGVAVYPSLNLYPTGVPV